MVVGEDIGMTSSKLTSLALRQAATRGDHWAGDEHLLLALLAGAPDDLARRAFLAVGIDPEAAMQVLVSHLESRAPPFPREYSGTLSSRHLHSILGRADGFTAGFEQKSPGSAFALLALLWDAGGVASILLQELSTSRSELLSALGALGVAMPSTAPPDVLTNPLQPTSEHEAVKLGHGFIGTWHVFLALLSGEPDDVAQQVLDSCGISYESYRSWYLERSERWDPPTQRRPDVVSARPNPAAWELFGRAEGLAAALGAGLVKSVHGLLAYLLEPRGEAVLELEHFETTPETVLERLRDLGIAVPELPIPEPDRIPWGERVDVPPDRLEEVRRALLDELPAGTWGFNRIGERAWVIAHAGIDLEAIVRGTLDRPH